jgi:hypothetical protein
MFFITDGTADVVEILSVARILPVLHISKSRPCAPDQMLGRVGIGLLIVGLVFTSLR